MIFKTPREHVDWLYRRLKCLQPAIALRCSLNYSDYPGEWLVLLAEVEACFLSLSKLYDAYEQVAKHDELLRVMHPSTDKWDLALTSEEDATDTIRLMEEVVAQWAMVYTKYMRMLNSNQTSQRNAA